MLTRLLSILAAAWLLAPADAQAQQRLYAASVRSGGVTQQRDVPIAGNLYAINLANGTATLVGPIRVGQGKPIGVTGMAAHPKTGVIFGITSEQSPHSARSLVTIDPKTATATIVGELSASGSDIAFDAKGTLYMWVPGTSQLAIVDASSAAITFIGRPGPQGSPAGIAIDPHGMVFVTAKGAGGTLDNVDLGTGALQVGPPLTGAPFSTQINSMSFSPSGLLLAVNSNGGSPAATRLVTINTASGAVATIGALPDDTDALAFTGGPTANLAPTFSTLNPGARVVVAVVSLLLVGLAALVLFRGRKR
jgi:DNA-binding beta-propeller fold protein YncE